MPLHRLPNWQSRLHGYLLERASARFAYGVMDCCLFAAGAIEAQTGVRIGAEFDGAYTTRAEAFEAIRKFCGKASIEAMAERFAGQFEIAEIAVSMAGRGDVVLVGSGARASLGVVALHGTEFVGLKSDGLWRASLANATRAWRI